jgi:hypothetical protein
MNEATTGPGTLFLEDEETETLFYQAEDGTLCFLSSFHMNCLRSEYSTVVPSTQTTTINTTTRKTTTTVQSQSQLTLVTDPSITTTSATSSTSVSAVPQDDPNECVRKSNELAASLDQQGTRRQQLHRNNNNNATQPLPDTIEGTVVELERVCLTPELRQRYRFLSITRTLSLLN